MAYTYSFKFDHKGVSDFDLEKAINANLESDSEEWIVGIAINAAHNPDTDY
jgi:hypothetical protein